MMPDFSLRIFRVTLLVVVAWALALPLSATPAVDPLADYAEVIRSRELYDPLNWRSERVGAERILSETESRMEIAEEMRNRPDRRSALDGSTISQSTIRERGREMYRILKMEEERAQRTLTAIRLVEEAVAQAIEDSDYKTFRNRQGQTMNAVLFDFDDESVTVLNRNLRPSRLSHGILSDETIDLIYSDDIKPLADRLSFVPDRDRAQRRERQVPEDRWVVLPPDFRFISDAAVVERDQWTLELPSDTSDDFLTSLLGDPVSEPLGIDPMLGQAYFLAVARISGNGEDTGLRQSFSSEGRYGYMVYQHQDRLQQLLFREGRVAAVWTIPAESPAFPVEPVADAVIGQPLPDTRPESGFSLRIQSPFLEFYRRKHHHLLPTRAQLHQGFAKALLQLGEIDWFVAGVKEGLEQMDAQGDSLVLSVDWQLMEGWISTPEMIDETFLVAGFLSQLLLKDLFPPVGLNLRAGSDHFLWEIEGGKAIEWIFRDRRFELRLAPDVEQVEIP